MRHIEIGAKSPDAAWIKKADALTKSLISAKTKVKRYEIIDKNQKVWGGIKKFLKDLNHGKCWYSESKEDYSYMHVDHFRPKKAAKGIDKKDHGGYWWLAFEWTNYRYCGSIGNNNKLDKFAVRGNTKAKNVSDPIADELHYFLDPIKRSDTEKLTFDQEGKAIPLAVNPKDWDFIRAQYTIDNLKLNDDGVKEARKKVWNDCRLLIKEITVLLSEVQKIPSVAKDQKIEDKMLELKKYLAKEAEYSSAAIACCISTALPWAIKLTA